MVLLCFVLDLPSISPPLIKDIKQALLQLGNYYAVSSWKGERESDSLQDRIGLCYFVFNRISNSNQLRISYAPRGNFLLRDFHHAVNNLPNDAFVPYMNDSGSAHSRAELDFPSFLNGEVLYSWGGKDIVRKVLLISSRLIGNMNGITRNTLMDAAEKCVSVEFVLLEPKSSHLGNLPEEMSNFAKSICDLENCSFNAYLPDMQVFSGLVKRWLRHLKDDVEEPFEVHLTFQNNLFGSLNSISCNLSICANEIDDGFNPCKTCRCHGIPLDGTVRLNIEGPSCCSLTGLELGACEMFENTIKVGKHTLLFLPSFENCKRLQQVYPPIDFNVMERTSMATLSEDVMIGSSYFVTPAASHEMECLSEETEKSELNSQLFQGLCNSLYALDQALICSSNCNIETMKEVSFQCYYILQASEKGPMLLRRLAGAEEVWPVCEFNRLLDTSVNAEVGNSVHASLLKMGLKDYNPLLWNRGFHRKLNELVKESLQFGSVPPKAGEATSKSRSTQLEMFEAITQPAECVPFMADDAPKCDLLNQEDSSTARITEEWEQLIVTDAPKLQSPTCMIQSRINQLATPTPESNKQLDANTSRILERLEAPRMMSTKAVSPVISASTAANTKAPLKKALIRVQPVHAAGHNLSSSQPMKPNFQRLKRKQR